MEIYTRATRMPKERFKNRPTITNKHGLDLRLCACGPALVGFMLVKKEYKKELYGFLGAMTHEEFRNKVYEDFEVSINDKA